MARIFLDMWMVCVFSLIFLIYQSLVFFEYSTLYILLWLTPDNLLILENPHHALMLADAKADATIVFYQHAICLGYDKLKHFGFPIHGAIDGYSRKILWLEVARSNNKPEIPARFFLECLRNTLWLSNSS